MSEPPPQEAWTVTSHLRELRGRLGRSVAAVFVGFVLCYTVSEHLLRFVAAPLRAELGEKATMVFIGLPEVFFAHLKVSFVAGLFLASPYVLLQAWRFVAPGLYRHERRLFMLFLAGSVALFFIGGAFAYLFVMPLAFKFFLGFSGADVAAYPTMQLYVSLVLRLTVAFGLAFEVPLVCILLVKLGAMSASTMRRQRRWVFVGAFVAAAVLTPPDIISQFMLAVPLYLLYETGAWIAARMEARAGEG